MGGGGMECVNSLNRRQRCIINKFISNMGTQNQVLKQLLLVGLLAVVCMSQCTFNPPLGNTELLANQCLINLNASIYDLCPTVVLSPETMIPRVCGFDGNMWRNYTYFCQAKNNNAYALLNRTCSCAVIGCKTGFVCMNGNCMNMDPCINVNCPNGFICQNGNCIQDPNVFPPTPTPPECTNNLGCQLDEQCVNQKCQKLPTCATIKCPDFEDCDNGICYKKFDYFCSTVQPQIIRYYCDLTRPTNQNCMDPVFLPPLTRTVCGVTYTGQKIDFPQGCSACKRQFIQYYYNQACSGIPQNMAQCSDVETCKNGVCELIDFCANVQCRVDQDCVNGICVDNPNFCASNNDCQRGLVCDTVLKLCIPDPTPSPCANVVCAATLKCVDGKCVDLCTNVNCPAQTQCRQGLCYTIDPICISNSDCPSGQICFMAKCRMPIFSSCADVVCASDEYCQFGVCLKKVVDPCMNVVCGLNEKCMNGQCMMVDPCMNVNCASDKKCMNGVCVDKCQGVTCPAGMMCMNGQCMKEMCGTTTCMANQKCVNNQCMANNSCSTNNECMMNEVCIGSRCYSDFPCVVDFNCFGHMCVGGICKRKAS